MIKSIRVAFGTGVALGIWRGNLAASPTTAHFLTYYEGRCMSNCKFCPQARESKSDLRMLSRVIWPRVDFEKVLAALKSSNEFGRICIQAVNYQGVVEDLLELTSRIKSICDLPISVSCQPLGERDIKGLAEAGADRVSVALDAATPELFERIKGDGYTWEGHMKAMDRAKAVFKYRVSTHLIVGLGETEEEIVRTIQLLHDMGVTVGLFAFTPVPGTPLSGCPPPDVSSYRRIQLARFLITANINRVEQMSFDRGQIAGFGVEPDVLNRTVCSGEPFRTSGCPHCNRPFYNESPKGPIYNYPRKPTAKDIEKIKAELGPISRPPGRINL